VTPILQLCTPTGKSIAIPFTSSLIKKTFNGNKVINSLQEFKKDDWLATKAYTYIAFTYLTRTKSFNQATLPLIN